jgi:single-strand DNA-binding protein
MTQGLNKAIMVGNLGSDSELRFTQGGQPVLSFRLATSESYVDKDKVRRERTDWHNVVVWGKRGEALAKLLHKGTRCYVEGSIRNSSYNDREGNKRYKTEIVANNVLLMGDRPTRAEGDGEGPRSGNRQAPPQGQRHQAGPPAGDDGGYGEGEGGGDGDADIPF